MQLLLSEILFSTSFRKILVVKQQNKKRKLGLRTFKRFLILKKYISDVSFYLNVFLCYNNECFLMFIQ